MNAGDRKLMQLGMEHTNKGNQHDQAKHQQLNSKTFEEYNAIVIVNV